MKSTARFVSLILLFHSFRLGAAQKPPLTLDEFFNSVSITGVRVSPDGQAVVVATCRPDWDHNRFRTDLWLYRTGKTPGLIELTQSGHDASPQWSPDGRWIAFFSDRPSGAPNPAGENPKATPSHIWVISPEGGEAFPLTSGKEGVHAFAWSADSQQIYFTTRTPWTKQQDDAYKREWKDVIQYRESERGDVIDAIELAPFAAKLSGNSPGGQGKTKPLRLAGTRYRVKQLAASPDGRELAFLTDSRSERQESLDPYRIYLVDLRAGNRVRLLSHTQAIYDSIVWSPDSRHLFTSYLSGSIPGSYTDAQPRLYWMDIRGADAGANGAPMSGYARWGARFTGALTDYAVLSRGGVLAAGRMGTEVQPYSESAPGAGLSKIAGRLGTYSRLATALHAPRIAFVHSALTEPPEVYLADDAAHIASARRITNFNHLFTERALARGRPFRWTADDGALVEGMLIYPPGKFEAKRLPMFTLIHGGPEDADGNHFEADWYQWAAVAATHGWLVFEPNYRGSIGYGDKFALGIIGPIVSRPGKDILEGVDALVKAGIADPDHLTVGGYSYGGYMTNWLITQTTRFKAAVSGAGAVEHVANWGNDDTSFDDAYFLGGLPWQARENYNAEAAIWQFARVTTPTHIVAGAVDIRVYVGEDYLLERALHARGIPTSLLIFPGEGHSLAKNPWHGKIKVREELKWLDKYCPHAGAGHLD